MDEIDLYAGVANQSVQTDGRRPILNRMRNFFQRHQVLNNEQ